MLAIYHLLQELEEQIGDGAVCSFHLDPLGLALRVDWPDDFHALRSGMQSVQESHAGVQQIVLEIKASRRVQSARQKLLRVRFYCKLGDPLPVNNPAKYPFWVEGESKSHSIVVSYADDVTYIMENWPDAIDLQIQEKDEVSPEPGRYSGWPNY